MKGAKNPLIFSFLIKRDDVHFRADDYLSELLFEVPISTFTYLWHNSNVGRLIINEVTFFKPEQQEI